MVLSLINYHFYSNGDLNRTFNKTDIFTFYLNLGHIWVLKHTDYSNTLFYTDVWYMVILTGWDHHHLLPYGFPHHSSHGDAGYLASDHYNVKTGLVMAFVDILASPLRQTLKQQSPGKNRNKNNDQHRDQDIKSKSTQKNNPVGWIPFKQKKIIYSKPSCVELRGNDYKILQTPQGLDAVKKIHPKSIRLWNLVSP